MNDQHQQRLEQFLQATSFQKEMGILIAHHDQESKDFEQSLQNFRFIRVSSTQDILKALQTGGRYYLAVTGENEKLAYDLATQYPTGQVGLFDDEKAKPMAAAPQYEHLCFVLLTTKPCLFDLREKGMDLLKKTGMAFQS